MQSMTSYKLTWAYFIIGSLTLLKVFQDKDKYDKLPFTKEQIIEWVYSYQIGDEQNAVELEHNEFYHKVEEHEYFGFKGDEFYQTLKDESGQVFVHQNDIPHLANTYSGICVLKMLGDDLKRLKSEEILNSLKYFQKEDGRIQALPFDSEDDVRFAYWAAAIYKILSTHLDTTLPPSFNIDLLTNFYKQWLSFDGGFGWSPFSESHAGLTYCLLGCFKCLDKMDEISEYKDNILEWLVGRQCMQMDGFQGRINKIPDTWYCFWNTASLAIMDEGYVGEFVFEESISEFWEECKRFGGYAKMVFSEFPDILHTFYTLSFFSLTNHKSLLRLDPLLAIPIP